MAGCGPVSFSILPRGVTKRAIFASTCETFHTRVR